MFKVGDRVKMVSKYNSVPYNSYGTIVNLTAKILAVDWDNFTLGHSCGGMARASHGWRVRIDAVRKITIKALNND